MKPSQKNPNLLIFPASSPEHQHLVPPKSEPRSTTTVTNQQEKLVSQFTPRQAKPSQNRTVQVCRQRLKRCTGQRFLKKEKKQKIYRKGEKDISPERTSVAAERARDQRENRICFLSGDDLVHGCCRARLAGCCLCRLF